MLKNAFEESSREIKSKDNVFGDFLVNKGLYDEIEITKDNIYELADLVGGHVKISIYCPKCGESRVFSCESIPNYWYDEHDKKIKENFLEDEIVSWQKIQDMTKNRRPEELQKSWTWNNRSLKDSTRLMVFKFVCAMDDTHHLDYIVLTNENRMKKIGQYPSVADLTFPELKEYRKIMTKTDEKEFRRAIGLYASGIGIGSFVYLRRIFERIIAKAGQKAIIDGKIQEDEFSNARVNEKIKMLSEYLPKALTNNMVSYGIISKGIHELSEEECIDYFPVLHDLIIMILRQWEKIRRDEEEEKKISVALNQIASKEK